jgi:hypothetical protein
MPCPAPNARASSQSEAQTGCAPRRGNLGELFGDYATLWFLVTKGEFRGAANMVFTIPQSVS